MPFHSVGRLLSMHDLKSGQFFPNQVILFMKPPKSSF